MFLRDQELQKEKQKIDDLLSILIPQFVHYKFIQHEQVKEENNDVAILFADICDYHQILQRQQKDIVKLLDSVYKEFDLICDDTGLQKIETVGPTYMAAAGIDEVEKTLHCDFKNIAAIERCILMADKMMNILKQQRFCDEKIQLKIGIHIGDVIAGVIGTYKPQFSLIGNTVNTTSRHTSTGSNGSINISEKAYLDLIKIQNQKENLKDKKLKRVLQGFKQETRFMKGLGDKVVYYKNDFEFQYHLEEKKYISQGKKSKFNFQKSGSFRNNMIHNNPIQNQVKNIQAQSANNLTNKNIDSSVKAQQPKKDINRVPRKSQLGNLKDLQQFEKVQQDIIIKNKFLITFDKNQNYEDFTLSQQKNQYKKQLIGLIYIYAILAQLTWNIREIFDGAYMWINVFIALFIVLTLFITSSNIFKMLNYSLTKVQLFLMIYFIFGLIPSLISYYAINSEIQIIYINMFLIILQQNSFQNIQIFSFGNSILLTLIIMICLIINVFLKEGQLYEELWGVISFYVFFSIQFLSKQYYINFHQINLFNNFRYNENMKKKFDSKVSLLLPSHSHTKIDAISEGLNSKLTNIAEEFDKVTILFADIKGFTDFSKSVQSPSKVVQMLKELFEEFDNLCNQWDVFKLYTIGDCYVTISFLNGLLRNSNDVQAMQKEAENTINLGLELVDHVNSVKDEYQGLITMRIGIHTGKIIGGIIGTKIVRYDIYGPDVVIANKMESNGEAGRVMVSADTKSLFTFEQNDYISDNFKFELKEDPIDITKLKIKDKKYMQAFFVEYTNEDDYTEEFFSQEDVISSSRNNDQSSISQIQNLQD